VFIKAGVNGGVLIGIVDPHPACRFQTVNFTAGCTIDHDHFLRWEVYGWPTVHAPPGENIFFYDRTFDLSGDYYVRLSCNEHYVGPKTLTITSCGLQSETVVETPLPRSRRTIGVCEEVTVTATDSATESVTWDVSNGGSLNPLTGPTTTFTAPDTATVSTVTATFPDGTECSIDFTILAPESVSMVVNSGIRHDQGYASVGFWALVTIGPTNVSFENVQKKEDACPATNVWGFFEGDTLDHEEGDWTALTPGNHCDDEIWILRLKKLKDGTDQYWAGGFTLPIPTRYRCWIGGNRDGHPFATVDTDVDLSDEGRMTVSKAGAIASKDLDEPTSGY